MINVVLTPKSLLVDDHDISLEEYFIGSFGVDEQWIDVQFGYPKRAAFVEEMALAKGYSQVADDGVNYYFFNGQCYGEGSLEIPCSELLAQMPALPRYTKFLGIDFENDVFNLKLKSDIDALKLSGLETKIIKTGYGGLSRRFAQFGPGGVIIAMTDDYEVHVQY